MSGQDRAGLSADYPSEYYSYLSIDTPFLDELSSDSSARGFCSVIVSASTEDLTGQRRKISPCASRQICRSKSMDRYRSDQRRSTRSSLSSVGGKRSRRASSGGSRRSASLRPSDLYLTPTEFRRASHCPVSGSPRHSTIPPSEVARKERKRRRVVLIIMVSFMVLALASVLVVVVTLTHSYVINDHNVTSKYYTFAVPPHHPLMRQENERIIQESFQLATPNVSQPIASQRKNLDAR